MWFKLDLSNLDNFCISLLPIVLTSGIAFIIWHKSAEKKSFRSCFSLVIWYSIKYFGLVIGLLATLMLLRELTNQFGLTKGVSGWESFLTTLPFAFLGLVLEKALVFCSSVIDFEMANA